MLRLGQRVDSRLMMQPARQHSRAISKELQTVNSCSFLQTLLQSFNQWMLLVSSGIFRGYWRSLLSYYLPEVANRRAGKAQRSNLFALPIVEKRLNFWMLPIVFLNARLKYGRGLNGEPSATTTHGEINRGFLNDVTFAVQQFHGLINQKVLAEDKRGDSRRKKYHLVPRSCT